MAVSQIEEKILGRLARHTSFPTRTRPGNEALSASFFQVLGLSILLSKKLVKARRLRKLDSTRDTKSLQLYHHIIWLAREGLAITETHILPYCQNGETGPECRVTAAKLRASFCHVFCLFHNFPPISQLSAKSTSSDNSPPSVLTPRAANGQNLRSPAKSPRQGKENNEGRRDKKKGALRDPIPSMNSETSYVTNPFAMGPAQTPPPAGPPPPLPPEARRTPTRPPGLTPIDIPATQAAASFLLPPMNWVPLTVEHFSTAQRLAEALLPPAHSLRLSIALEHAAFLWDCEKNHQRARHLARKTIKEVYSSTEGLDDDEFLDASSLVQALGGIVRRGSNESTPRPSQEQVATSPPQTTTRAPPPIDRTIAVSPTKNKQGRGGGTTATQSPRPPIFKTPDRLSTVPEVASTEAISKAQTPRQPTVFSPPVSRLSSRSRSRGASSDKASKRRAVEQAEERASAASAASGSSNNSRQPTPQEGLSTSTFSVPAGGGGGRDDSSRTSPSKTDLLGYSQAGREEHDGGGGGGVEATMLPIGMAVPMVKPLGSSLREKGTPGLAPPAQLSRDFGVSPANRQPKVPLPVDPPFFLEGNAEREVERGSIPIIRDFAPPPASASALAPPPPPTAAPPGSAAPAVAVPQHASSSSKSRTHARDRREAILRALEIVGAVERGLYVPGQAVRGQEQGRVGGGRWGRGMVV